MTFASSPRHPSSLDGLRARLQHGYGTVTAKELKSEGLTPGVVRGLISEGVLQRVGHGAYVDAEIYAKANPERRYVLRVTAIARTWPPGVLVSHTSAAMMRGLPLTVRPGVVHGCRRAAGQHRKHELYTIHTGYSDAGFSVINGVRVIESAFVVMGVAELHGRDQAVIVGDAALHRGETTVDRLHAIAKTRRFHPAHAVFSRAIALMDPRTESVGETRTRLLLRTLGHDVVPQVVIRDQDGEFIGRVDFLIRGTRVVIEFDGMTKYGSAADLVNEKRREMRLTRAGYHVVRLVWDDLASPTRVRNLIESVWVPDVAAG